MATIILQTPSVIPFSPFDPSHVYTVTFSYSGNQPMKNRAVITDNRTGTTVYDSTQNTMKLQHEIPAGTLIAGNPYLIQIQVFDSAGNASSLSEPTLFYCFSAPVFVFDSIAENDTYRNASISLSVRYSQTEEEPLRSLQFLEYSYDKTLLAQSDTLYAPAPYTFYGLNNNTSYYFRAIGETIHGMPLDTGFIKLNIEYQTLPANIIFHAENNYNEGYIRLTSGIKDIEYEFENENYILKDGMLTLKENSLKYLNSFDIGRDFVLFIEAKKIPLQRFLTTNDNAFSLSIVNICDTYYCQLTVKDSALSMFVSLPKARLSTDAGDLLVTDRGDMIEIVNTSYDDEDFVIFEVKRVGHLYSLNSYYRSEIEA